MFLIFFKKLNLLYPSVHVIRRLHSSYGYISTLIMRVFPLFVILAGFLQLDQSADHVIIESIIAGIGIEADAAGIGIPAPCISVRHRGIPVPYWVLLSRYGTGSGIGIFLHSGTGLIRCQKSTMQPSKGLHNQVVKIVVP